MNIHELKRYAGYNLPCIYKGESVKLLSVDNKEIAVLEDNKGRFFYGKVKDLTPFSLPIKELAGRIYHKGEFFNPMERLIELFVGTPTIEVGWESVRNNQNEIYKIVCGTKLEYLVYYPKHKYFMLYNNSYAKAINSDAMLEKLFEWNFDVFGWLESK